MKFHVTFALLALMLAAFAPAQSGVMTAEEKAKQDAAKRQTQLDQKRQETIREAESAGTPVEMSAIGGFRGARSNKIMGYGLVVGLAGTGDSKQIEATSNAMANALTRWGTLVTADQFKAKNIAIVSVTAELPAFAAPGRKIDLTVQSLGDAKSLEGGYLLPTTLGSMVDNTTVYAVASGALSIGGWNAGASGSSERKNHATVGRVPGGGDIQRSVDTKFVFTDNMVFFDLDEPDFTTAQRVAEKIRATFPGLPVTAQDAVTIAIQIPDPADAVQLIAGIQKLEVKANTPPTIVINERTGTIVIGGNVRLGPALIAHGGLRVKIDTEFVTSQPGPFSQGQTTTVPNSKVTAGEDPPQVVVVAPNATLDDLAKIFQAMGVSARDIIAILQALADQGALKARIKIQ